MRVFTPPGIELRDCDALIVLDTGTWNQLADVGPFVRTFTGEKAVIDHHGTQDDLGAMRLRGHQRGSEQSLGHGCDSRAEEWS